MYCKRGREANFLSYVLPFYKSANAWVKYLTTWHRFLYIDVGQYFELARHCLLHILQLLKHLVNLSPWMFFGAIRISSFFSFWKRDYFSDIVCLKNPLFDMISWSSSSQLIVSNFSPWHLSQIWTQDMFH